MSKTIKIAIIGETGAGKTTFLKAFANYFRGQNWSNPVGLFFANADTADFLAGYTPMSRGKFPESTLEHSKAKLCFKLDFGSGASVFLDTVDPMGQYISRKIQGGKKRVSEYEEQINQANVALVLMDACALKSGTMQFLGDYHELLCKCMKKNCEIAILLTKSDLLCDDDLKEPKAFLARYFPELIRHLHKKVHVQFISIGRKEILDGKNVLNIYKPYGFVAFSRWLCSLIPDEVFLSPREKCRLHNLRNKLRSVITRDSFSTLKSDSFSTLKSDSSSGAGFWFLFFAIMGYVFWGWWGLLGGVVVGFIACCFIAAKEERERERLERERLERERLERERLERERLERERLERERLEKKIDCILKTGRDRRNALVQKNNDNVC